MRLVLSVGESSGDFLAAHLIQQLKSLDPNLEVAGIAGPLMMEAGATAWFEMNELNVMGLQEVLVHLPRIWQLRRQFAQRILKWQPDAFIGVDAPDFNLGLARRLRAKGLLTMHYVSPSIWAWRENRAKKMAHSVDRLLTLFPFEPPLYQPYGLQADYVGHPLVDVIDASVSNTAPSFSGALPRIALLPGSRWAEIQRHVPLLIETANELKGQCSWVMPVVDDAAKKRIESVWGEQLKQHSIELLAGQTRSVIATSSVALAASGTVTLETFLLGVPQVVFYRLSPTTHWLARQLKLIKSRWISLPNILTDTELVPELIQQQATPQRLAEALRHWLCNESARAHYQAKAQQWRQTLKANGKAARSVLAGIQNRC